MDNLESFEDIEQHKQQAEVKLEEAKTLQVIEGMSISVEKLPPVSVQKFPHGLVGYSVFNPDFLCLNR